MKSVMGLYLLFLFSLPFTNAQTSQMLKNPDLHTFNINFIEGYALSYNFLTTDKFWIRAELDLYMYGQDTEGDGSQFYRTDGSYSYGNRSEIDQNSNSNNLQISLSSPILFPIYKSDFGFIYFGAGSKTNNM